MRVGLHCRDGGRGDERLIAQTTVALVNAGHRLYLDAATSANLLNSGELDDEVNFGRLEDFSYTGLEFMLVFGGDGTMLGVARNLRSTCPILGVNHGHLGFITDLPKTIDPNQLVHLLTSPLERQLSFEQRTMLGMWSLASITGHSFVTIITALNEITISRLDGQLIELTVHVDEELAFKMRADGLIISTPTGSTAYSMAAGGPIMHPATKAIILLPLAPQTLSHRPLIVPESSKIKVQIDGDFACFNDGQKVETVGSTIGISMLDETVTFAHPKLTYSYFNTLRQKLNWHVPHGS